jgi:hypothetical protein
MLSNSFVPHITIDMKGIICHKYSGHSRKDLYVYDTYNISLLDPGDPGSLGTFVYVVPVETSRSLDARHTSYT